MQTVESCKKKSPYFQKRHPNEPAKQESLKCHLAPISKKKKEKGRPS